MSTVGQREKLTQRRVVGLFRGTLGYDYLGDWTDREDNRNVEPGMLWAFLKKKGYDDALILRALHVLHKAAGDASKSLYDRNREVYELLRYPTRLICLRALLATDPLRAPSTRVSTLNGYQRFTYM
jgi:type I restriction enzyme, R subunit